MMLINYIDLFYNKQINVDYKKSEYTMFTEYAYHCLGLITEYSKGEDENDIYRIEGFKVYDDKKWLLTKIKYGL